MILRLLLLALLAFLIARALRTLVRGAIAGATGAPPGPTAPPVKLVRDPVCGTHVAPRASLSLASGGSTHYFCSPACRDKYRARM